LWVKLRYNDGETLEGVVPNDLLSLLDNGLQITTPDLNSSTDRIFVPRAALTEVTVLVSSVSLAGSPPLPQPPLPSPAFSTSRLFVGCTSLFGLCETRRAPQTRRKKK